MSLPKLLLLHGALGSASQFDGLKESLEHRFEIFTMNFPGHGGREIPAEEFSFPLFSGDAITFLDTNNIEAINIFGYSMGGYTGLWMAKNFPARVNKIFTLATKLDWNEATSQREASMLNADKMAEKIPAFTKMLEQRHAPEDWKQVVNKTAGMMIDLGRNHLSKNDFKSIKHPVRISIGDKDNMVSMDESKNASDLLPNGSLHVFTDMQHPFEKVDLNKLVPELNLYFTE